MFPQTFFNHTTMSQPHIYTKDDIAKIGNTLVYFAERVPELSKTKLLKLVYLLEETTVRRCARPFLNLDFEVWKLGQVAKDLFVDLSSTEQYMLKDYVRTCPREEGRVYSMMLSNSLAICRPRSLSSLPIVRIRLGR